MYKIFTKLLKLKNLKKKNKLKEFQKIVIFFQNYQFEKRLFLKKKFLYKIFSNFFKLKIMK